MSTGTESPQGRAAPSPPPEGVKETWGGPAFPCESNAAASGGAAWIAALQRNLELREGAVSVAQTHISWVLLTPQFAYKIKKPVHLSFLDFSTLARRKH
ncbi:MAG TPA: hypothetical protein VGA59_08825, partial [Ramlibacter sp.]